MASSVASPTPIRAVIIDGPEAGRIIDLMDALSPSQDEQRGESEAWGNAVLAAEHVEKRASKVQSNLEAALSELRNINRGFAEARQGKQKAE